MQATKERFITQWRPTTSFGYQDFDLDKHLKKEKRRKKAVKEAEKIIQKKQFFYFSKPMVIADYNSNKAR